MPKIPISETYNVSQSMPHPLSHASYNLSNSQQQSLYIQQSKSNSSPNSRQNSNTISNENLKQKNRPRLQSSIIKNRSIIQQPALSLSKISSPSRIKLSNKQSVSIQQQQNKTLYKEIHQSILIQSKIRHLNKKIQLEQEILRNKQLYDEVQKELRQHQLQIKQKKRQIIKNKLAQIQLNKKLRGRKLEESQKRLQDIKYKQRQRQIILNKIIQTDKKQFQQCYENTLKQRKKLLKPMNFQVINKHQKKYLRSKKIKTQGDQQNQLQNSNKQQNKINLQKQPLYHSKSEINSKKNEIISKNLRYLHSQRIIEQEQQDQTMNNSAQIFKNHKRTGNNRYKNKKKIRSAIDSYLQQRHKQQQKIQKIKEVIQKSKQFGNRVERLYYNNRSITQQIQAQRKQRQKQEAQQKAKMINQRNQLLKNMKKPELPKQVNVNAEIGKNYELKKLIQSNDPPHQKMLKLNHIAEAQLNRLKNKGKSWDLQRLNKINMLRAQLLLTYQ